MAPVSVGSTEIETVYVGSTEADRIYLGSDEVWASFDPVDMLFNTPGTYTLNVGRANRVYISGRGADGGAGGGGGAGYLTFSDDDRWSGGPGGTGGPGPDGQTGFEITTDREWTGGGGEGGETPADAEVTGIGVSFTAESGRAGAGGAGGRRSTGGGVPTGGSTDTLATNISGGSRGSTGLGAMGGAGSAGSPGESPYLGETVAEQEFTVTADQVLTIVVPARGVGGNGGGAVRQGNGGMGQSGIDDGWIRIRTERV